MVKFIDLFAGTGGIRLAFQSCLTKFGIESECVKSAEIDKQACETYQLNFGVNPFCDVHTVNEIKPFDVLLAGFPCQAFSYAGKQLGFSDTRGTLFFEVERILEKYRPGLCFLENVRGLTTHDHGRTLKTILGKLEHLGYHVKYRLLNSSNFGVPQNRVRIYIIASLEPIERLTINNDTGASDSHDFKQFVHANDLFGLHQTSYVKDILEDNPDPVYDCSSRFVKQLKKIVGADLAKLHGVRLIDTRHGNSIHSWDLGIKGDCTDSEIAFMNQLISNRRKHVFGVHQDGKALTRDQIFTFYNKNNLDALLHSLLDKGYLRVDDDGKYNPVCGNMSFEVFKFLDPESISITLTASDSHKLGVFHKGRLRRLTPRECARLQGYPESYKLHPTDASAYKQIGNAVTVPVIEQLLEDYFNNNVSKIISPSSAALSR